MAQWITRLTTDQKIPGSNPGKLEFFYGYIFLMVPENNIRAVHTKATTALYKLRH